MAAYPQTRLIFKLLAFIILSGLMAPAARAEDDLTTKIIRDKIEQIRFFEEVKLGDASIASTKVLPEIYEQQNFRLLWTEPNAILQLVDAVRNIKDDGLNPEDYHLKELLLYHKAIQAIGQNDPWLSADFDILLTDSFIRLAYHLYFGKVDPATLNPGWNLSRQLNSRNPAKVIKEIIDAGSIKSTIDSLKPRYPVYLRLKAALAKYRQIQSQGSWPHIAAGGVLRKGDRDARIGLIRKRLALTDEIPAVNDDPDVFDQILENAVKRFQTREELEPDGSVDRPTLIELNHPVEWRIDQLRANLERMRWFLHDLPEQFVVVDIAGFVISHIERNRITWTARAQVGDPFAQTPCFKADIHYMVLNPSWTVPPGIAQKEYVPMLLKNPDFLVRAGLKLMDRQGKFVAADSLDWGRYAHQAFPYKFLQEPGPTNPLGRIKFICPNPFYVYLHDTPETEGFSEPWRAFSSGCIRVEKPLEFAVLLMGDNARWPLEKIRALVASGKTRTIFLPRKIPVMFLYITVLAEQNGMIYFRDDLYGRDKAVIKGLSEPFEFRNIGIIDY
jgi:murein L,D-transpeptidase YcbB/YkuD